MKRYIFTLLMATALVACSESGDESPQSQLNIGEGSVTIAMSVEGFVAETITKAEEMFEIPTRLLPTEDELSAFELHITGTYYHEGDTSELLTFDETYESIEAYNTAGTDKSDPTILTPPYLPAGDYTATITDGRDRATEGEGAEYGCFSGEMEFTVVAQRYDAEQSVTAYMDNSLVRLQLTEGYETYFPESSLQLKSGSGTIFTFDFPIDEEAEERFVFVEAATTLYLAGSATKQDPGNGSPATVIFETTEIGSALAGGVTTVVVDAASAGTLTVEVTVDDSITTIYEQSIDLNDVE